MLINLVLNSIILPTSQDKARSFIRTSDLDFFESILKPKKFIDIIQGLTIYFDTKDKNGELKKLFLKNNSGINSFQVTYAQTGRIELRDNRKVLVLYNGKSIKSNDGQISVLNFEKTDYNIAALNSKTTTTQKTQENSTKELLECFFILQEIKTKEKNINNSYEFNNCRISNLENIYESLYGRIVKPFYNTLLIMIALLIILKSKDDHTFTSYKLKIYIFGFLFIIFLEMSSKFIGINLLYNFFISILPIFLFSFLYVYFITKLKFKN